MEADALPQPIRQIGDVCCRRAVMIAVQHFGSISGGKDSQAVLCLMVERIERKGMVVV
jgi:hypothetical protein